MKESPKFNGIPCPECKETLRYLKSKACVKCHILKVEKKQYENRTRIKINEAEAMHGVNYGG